jgi:hypothetical protein
LGAWLGQVLIVGRQAAEGQAGKFPIVYQCNLDGQLAENI